MSNASKELEIEREIEEVVEKRLESFKSFIASNYGVEYWEDIVRVVDEFPGINDIKDFVEKNPREELISKLMPFLKFDFSDADRKWRNYSEKEKETPKPKRQKNEDRSFDNNLLLEGASILLEVSKTRGDDEHKNDDIRKAIELLEKWQGS